MTTPRSSRCRTAFRGGTSTTTAASTRARPCVAADPDGSIARAIDPASASSASCRLSRGRCSRRRASCTSSKARRFTLGELDGSTSRRASRRFRRASRGGLQGAGHRRHPQRDLAQAVGQSELQPDQRADACDARRTCCRFPLTRELCARDDDARRRRSRRSSASRFASASTNASPAPRRSARTRPRCCRTSSTGRPLEIEALVGAVVELGRLTDTPTPHIDAVYACTRLLAQTHRRRARAC